MKIRNGNTYVSSDRITLDLAGLTSKSLIRPSVLAARLGRFRWKQEPRRTWSLL